jgi:hypothetical protein
MTEYPWMGPFPKGITTSSDDNFYIMVEYQENFNYTKQEKQSGEI